MKTTIMAILFTLILTTAAFAATVTLNWTPITDTNVVKVNIYYTTAAGCSSLVPKTPAVSPWILSGSITAPTATDAVPEVNSGTYCYYATSSSSSAESGPSNVAVASVPLPVPVLGVPVVQ